ncbi:hypothetical protein DLAC_01355 [Tieghemostelium lacteum]|uniref:Uncharacterized protein n=1 Tax=Tieghemostelium lacteum TaxID=361077 RepID=A0A152A8D4_TIELA|nr:hypothetical protein DLAC_01355 [Tieghemostelium lacteum]|eukprot:KYR02509.1 hypothetical protein DLAC_01355 [Tieghemostelium lacteum]
MSEINFNTIGYDKVIQTILDGINSNETSNHNRLITLMKSYVLVKPWFFRTAGISKLLIDGVINNLNISLDSTLKILDILVTLQQSQLPLHNLDLIVTLLKRYEDIILSNSNSLDLILDWIIKKLQRPDRIAVLKDLISLGLLEYIINNNQEISKKLGQWVMEKLWYSQSAISISSCIGELPVGSKVLDYIINERTMNILDTLNPKNSLVYLLVHFDVIHKKFDLIDRMPAMILKLLSSNQIQQLSSDDCYRLALKLNGISIDESSTIKTFLVCLGGVEKEKLNNFKDKILECIGKPNSPLKCESLLLSKYLYEIDHKSLLQRLKDNSISVEIGNILSVLEVVVPWYKETKYPEYLDLIKTLLIKSSASNTVAISLLKYLSKEFTGDFKHDLMKFISCLTGVVSPFSTKSLYYELIMYIYQESPWKDNPHDLTGLPKGNIMSRPYHNIRQLSALSLMNTSDILENITDIDHYTEKDTLDPILTSLKILSYQKQDKIAQSLKVSIHMNRNIVMILDLIEYFYKSNGNIENYEYLISCVISKHIPKTGELGNIKQINQFINKSNESSTKYFELFQKYPKILRHLQDNNITFNLATDSNSNIEVPTHPIFINNVILLKILSYFIDDKRIKVECIVNLSRVNWRFFGMISNLLTNRAIPKMKLFRFQPPNFGNKYCLLKSVPLHMDYWNLALIIPYTMVIESLNRLESLNITTEDNILVGDDYYKANYPSKTMDNGYVQNRLLYFSPGSLPSLRRVKVKGYIGMSGNFTLSLDSKKISPYSYLINQLITVSTPPETIERFSILFTLHNTYNVIREFNNEIFYPLLQRHSKSLKLLKIKVYNASVQKEFLVNFLYPLYDLLLKDYSNIKFVLDLPFIPLPEPEIVRFDILKCIPIVQITPSNFPKYIEAFDKIQLIQITNMKIQNYGVPPSSYPLPSSLVKILINLDNPTSKEFIDSIQFSNCPNLKSVSLNFRDTISVDVINRVLGILDSLQNVKSLKVYSTSASTCPVARISPSYINLLKRYRFNNIEYKIDKLIFIENNKI